jgi:F0F1-type ATP synthase membrane subunit b/b'
MYFGPLAGLFGAAMVSFTAFKWMILSFIILLGVWIWTTTRKNRNALTDRAIKDLIKSASQWATRSAQDANGLVSLMNANYAMAYLNVARSVGSDADIERVTGAAVDELMKDIESNQSNAIQKMALSCPSMAPAGLATAHTGWLSK